MTRVSVAALVLSLLLLGGCSTMRSERPPTASFALAEARDSTLGRAAESVPVSSSGQSGFRLIVSGREAFATRAVLADLAERSLDLQYYSAADDMTTDLLLLRIEAAAQRGVRVRILLDDIYPPARRFAQRAAAQHPGIQVRLYNPFFWSDSWDPVRVGELIADAERLNRRMHNKLWIADNAAAVIGSRNLGDAYFDGLESGNFSDVDLFAMGPIVGELSRCLRCLLEQCVVGADRAPRCGTRRRRCRAFAAGAALACRRLQRVCVVCIARPADPAG